VPTDHLDIAELTELHPAELILECAGVRHAPRYDTATIDELRAVNRRFRRAADPEAAASADEEFHRRLVSWCGNGQVVDALEPLKRRLSPYRRLYLAGHGRIARSAAQHEAIIRALARGDHADAERRLRAYLRDVRDELLADLQGAGTATAAT
jgi:GntR family transcriptional regulator, transcriptional repressor for pyruvate dehydrogenase complex